MLKIPNLVLMKITMLNEFANKESWLKKFGDT